MPKSPTLLVLLALLATPALAQERPAYDVELPPIDGELVLPVIQAKDAAALRKHMGQKAIVVGTVEKAEWSDSGAVMNVTFKNVPDTIFGVAVFKRSKDSFENSFGGDVAKSLTGATVRLSGELQAYGGYDERLKGAVQMLLFGTNQLTIEQPAP